MHTSSSVQSAFSLKFRKLIHIFTVAALLAGACFSTQPAGVAQAADETCTAENTGRWDDNTGSVWYCDGGALVPGPGDDVVIPAWITVTVVNTATALDTQIVRNLTIETDGQLIINDGGVLPVIGALNLYGSITINGSGQLNLGAVTHNFFSPARVDLNNTATITTDGDLVMMPGTTIIANPGTSVTTGAGLSLSGRIELDGATLTQGSELSLRIGNLGVLLADHNSVVNSTGDLVVDGELDVFDGSVVNIGRNLDAPGNLYTNTGIFNFSSGASQTINTHEKNVSFGTLRKHATTAGETLSFSAAGASGAISVGNLLELTGTAANPLLLRSTTPGSQFKLTVPSEGTQTLDYLDVKDANAEPFTMYPIHWTKSGNNTYWEQGTYPTTTSVTATPASGSSVYGESFTYSVHVSSAQGTPAGSVTMRENGISYGSAVLDGSGDAVITLDMLPVGVHSGMTAHYNGALYYASSDGAAGTGHTVTQATASTSLSAPATAVYGEPITLSAAVSSSNGLPTGAVTFSDGETALKTVMLDENGAARMLLTPETGVHNFSADYSGSPNHAASEDTASTTVNAPDLLLTVTAGASDSDAGTCTAGVCTHLRAAISAANAVVDPSATVTIVLSENPDKYWMTVEPTGADDNSSGDFDLTHSVNFVGAGSEALQSTIVGSQFVGRVFHVHGAIAVNFSHLRVQSGNALEGENAVDGSTPPTDGQHGGAIYNEGAGSIQTVGVFFHVNQAGSGGSDEGGFGLDGADGGSGGAIYNPTGGSLVVYDTTFENNSAGQGGGRNQHWIDAETGGQGGQGGSGGAIYNAGSMTVIDSYFDANFSGSGGYGSDGTTTAGSGGPAGNGGAIYSSADFSVADTTFSGNRSGSGSEGGYINTVESGQGGDSGNGGAIAVSAANASITTSIFSQNNGGEVKTSAAGGEGGALYADGASGTLTVKRSYFNNNEAGDADTWTPTGGNGANGGAIAVAGSAALVVENSTFYNNQAGYASDGEDTTDSIARSGGSGGAIYYNSDASASKISYSTISRNNTGLSINGGAEGKGAGIDFLNGSGSGALTLQSSVLMENWIGNAGVVASDCADDGSNRITSGGYNYIFNGASSCTLSVDATDQYHDGQPLQNGDIVLGSPGAFGGPTPTFAITPTGPLVDQAPAGTAGCASTVTVDQRGMPRGQGGLCDIGAYEFGGIAGLTKEGGDNQVASASGTPGSSSFADLKTIARDALNAPLLRVNVSYLAIPNANGASLTFQANENPKIDETEIWSPYQAAVNGGANSIIGSHTVTASAGAYSVTFNLANRFGTSTALALDPGFTVFGQPVTATATVAPSDATGAVRFEQSGGAVITGCEARPITSGQATCTFNDLNQSSYPYYLYAIYSGDGLNYTPSTSSSQMLYVSGSASTTTTVSADPASPVNTGATVTFTATVTAASPSTAVPTGTLAFSYADGGSISGCTTQTLSAGQATCTPNPVLSPSTYTIKASYTPANTNFSGSSKDDFSFVVNSTSPTTTTLSAPSPANPVVGEQVTFSYSVSGSASPGGNVNIMHGITVLCTGTVAEGSCAATFHTAAADLSITAVYAGDTNNAASTSAAQTLTVSAADTTAGMDTDLSTPSVVGQALTVSADIAPTVGSGAPAGLVTITAGPDSCSYTLPGETACQLTFTSPGEKTITITFAGNTNYNGSTGSASHTVNAADTVTSIAASIATHSVTGETVTVTASVAAAPPGAGAPGGVITVSSGALECTITLGSETSCDLTFTTQGSKTVTAAYSGDANFNGSSDSATHLVDAASTTTTVTSNPPTQANVGTPVIFTAQVAVTAPGSGMPTGTVSFSSDGSAIATCQDVALNGSQQAACTPDPALAIGAYDISAVFTPGSPDFLTSTSPDYTFTVNDLPATTTALDSAAPASAVVGQQVTFNYSVSSTEGSPAGNVSVKNGAITLCSATVAAGACQYTFTQAGDQDLTVVYAGSADHNPSQAAFTYIVNPAVTTIAAPTGLPASSDVGQAVTVSAAVSISAPGGGIVSGVVTITDGSDSCSYTLPGETSCALVFTSAGTKSVSASFHDPDGNFSDAGPGTSASHTVAPAAPDITVVPDKPNASQGEDVTFKARVEVGAGGVVVPSGTVSFSLAGAPIPACQNLPLDSNGEASCTISGLAVGDNNVQIDYTPPAGSPDFLSSTEDDYIYSVKHNTATNLVSASPASAVVGQPVTFNFTVTSDNGAPAGDVTVNLDETMLCTGTVAEGDCTYTFASAGTYILRLDYSGSSTYNTSSKTFTFTVNPAATTTTLVIEETPTTPTDHTVIANVTVAAAAPGSGAPTGTVTVASGAVECSIILGSAASCNLTFSEAGPKTITATYQNLDGNFTGSADTVTYGVIRYFYPLFANN